MKVLFVTNDASRTGAPLFLLHFLLWLRVQHTEVKFDLLVNRCGELDKEYIAVADSTYYWQRKSRFIDLLLELGLLGKRRKNLNELFRRLANHEERLLSRLGSNGYDLVFVNSFANSQIIPLLATHIPRIPIVCRPPELRVWVEESIGIDFVREAIKHVDKFVAVSDLVASYLKSGLGIPSEQIVKIPGFVRGGGVRRSKCEIRNEIDVAEDAFLVCGCGTLDWRKGADLFIQVAALITRRDPDRNIRFCWIGGGSEIPQKLQFDLDMLNLRSPIIFIPSTDAPLDYFSACDLFALTSREDPFPLVALEAASCALPIVCFDAAVGSKEFVCDNTGKLVPYLDIAAFAAAITSFQDDHVLYGKVSANVKTHSDSYSIDRIGNRLLMFMRDNAANGPKIAS